LLEALDEFALGFFPDCSEVLAEAAEVRCVIVGGYQVVVDVGVADFACCAAKFAEGALERFGFLVDAGDIGGESEQLECGFDAPCGGTQSMDAPGRRFFEAVCDGRLEHQALTQKDGNRLRHDVTPG
jgi:hypothetical protein